VGRKKYFFILISKSHLQNEIGDYSLNPFLGSSSPSSNFFHISFSSSSLSRKWIWLVMEEKGENKEFWLKTHNVATNYWGKGGL
jgi:hypothetical protein